MTESIIKSLIESTLNIPVYDAADAITYPSATVEVSSDSTGLFGDGRGTGRVKSVNIDLWYESKSDRDTAVQSLLTALDSQNGNTTPDIITMFDTTAHKWRATFNFEFI